MGDLQMIYQTEAERTGAFGVAEEYIILSPPTECTYFCVASDGTFIYMKKQIISSEIDVTMSGCKVWGKE